MEYVVWDCEIKSVIDGKNVTWDDFGKMGISVACAYSSRTGDFSAHMDDNLEDLWRMLEEADVIVGFNILGFDIPLLEATVHQKLRPKKVYDILEYSRKSTGWTPDQKFPKGLRLDNHLEGTFGKDSMKTADGAEAPLMWQAGKIGTLVSYCLADVARELKLFRHVLDGRSVKTATHGERWLDITSILPTGFEPLDPIGGPGGT